MDALQAIFTRRSVRQYTAEPVSAADEETLLRAAMSAPSAGNTRPWHFVVIRSRAVLDAIAAFHPSAPVVQQAPLAILVCGLTTIENYPGRWIMDCANAAQNILLAAHALGLGAVWLGINPDPMRMAGMIRAVGLPEEMQPVALVAVGHPAESPEPAERFDRQRIHRDHW